MKKVLNILIVLSCLDLVGIGAFWYGYSSLQDLKAHETDLRSQIADQDQQAQKLAALKGTLTAAIKERTDLEHFLVDPSDENQISLISEIEGLGTTTGASLETTSFALVDGTPPLLHGEFAVGGTWSQLYRVLRLIESYPSRVVVDRYDIHLTTISDPGKPSVDRWDGTLGIDFAALKQVSQQ